MESVVLISDIVFVKRGVAKHEPDRLELDTQQLKDLLAGAPVAETSDDSADEEGKDDMEGEQTDADKHSTGGLRGSAATSEVGGDDDDEKCMEEFLKDYDKDEKTEGIKMTGIAMFSSPLEDPYITKHTDSDEEEEKDDFLVRPDDNLVVAAKVDKGMYSLEVRVYNETNGDFYVHHDYLLEAPPLCLEPFHYDPGADNHKGNLLAVGTMSGSLEVWDLDIVNSIEPAIILAAGAGSSNKKKKKGKGKGNTALEGHEDAVLACRWNQSTPHVLASGDAEGVLILWDIDEAKAATVIQSKQHGGIQSLHWHPVEAAILLSGTMAGVISARDCREADKICAQWDLGSSCQVEKVLWDHNEAFYALVSADDGRLRYIDMRKPNAFVHDEVAHEGGVEALGISAGKNRLAATGGTDEMVAVWSVSPTALSVVHRTAVSVGSIHSITFSPNSPFILSVGGDQGELIRILDLAKYEQVVTACPI